MVPGAGHLAAGKRFRTEAVAMARGLLVVAAIAFIGHAGSCFVPTGALRDQSLASRVANAGIAARATGSSLSWVTYASSTRTSAVGACAALAVLGAAVSTSRRTKLSSRRHLIAVAVEEAEGPAPPELLSEKDVDYSTLQSNLAEGDFKAADAETRRLLIVLAGAAAEKRGWVYFSEVKTIPETDMMTLDNLWKHYSNGKLGYSSQRKIWRQCRGQFDKFAEKVSWFTDTWTNRNWPDEFIYDITAPAGHLPLTNCIRGAQVLQEIMEHPAFEKKKKAAMA